MISIMIGAPTLLPKKSDDGRIYLPHSFEPSDKDVICGWAKQNHLHPGNRRFRDLTELSAPLYDAAGNKQKKTQVIASLVQRIRRESPGGGGFVKRDPVTGLWYEIGDDKARDKVGHAIRRVIDEKKKKNQWSALVKLVLKGAQIVEEHSKSATLGGLSEDTKPPAASMLEGPRPDDKAPSLDSRSKGLRMPSKQEPIALSWLEAVQRTASLPRDQGSLGSSNAAPLTLANLAGMNDADTLNHRQIPSNPYITESTLRIVQNLRHMGSDAKMNSSSMQGTSQSSGRQSSDFHSLHMMLDQPPADFQKQLQGLSASHKLGSVALHGGDDTMPSEQLFLATLDPTPIGPNAIIASNSADNKKDDKSETDEEPPRLH